jgi:hypothetical protein
MGTHVMSTWFWLKNRVSQKWYRSHVNHRKASLYRRVLSLVIFLIFAKYFVLISRPCSRSTKPNFYGYLLSFSFAFLDDKEVDSEEACLCMPRRNVVPTEFHSDGRCAGYFPRTPRTLLLALGYSEPNSLLAP